MPDPRPLVSIVTPSFNQGPYIEATIASVLAQDYPRVEYFVADGGSTDQTVSILQRYNDQLKWVSEKDAGQSDAINKGFSRTTGQILGWLNSDDTLAPGAIAAVVDYFEQHPDVALVYGDAEYIDAQGQRIARCAHIEPFNAHRLIHYSDFIVQPAAFFRRTAFEAVGGVDASLHLAMDYDLWWRLYRRFGKPAFVDDFVAVNRVHGATKTATLRRRHYDEAIGVVKRHYGRVPLKWYLAQPYAVWYRTWKGK
jgi:glycosyltransferase involved in cell wall biosynthesis